MKYGSSSFSVPPGKLFPPENEVLTKKYMQKVSPEDEYFGILIAQTWSGVINLSDSDIQKRISQAKKKFKEITGKEGNLLLIGG